VLLAAGLWIWALVAFVTGGVFLEWHGWRLSSRDPVRPLMAAAVVVAWALWRYGRQEVLDETLRIFDKFDLSIDFDRWAPPLAFLIALVTLLVGLTWTTRIAGGADSFGYVSQAQLWVNGDLTVKQPIAATVPWPNADSSFTPLGYRPAIGGGAIVPTYAPGYPMLMALFSLIDSDAVFWVVPLAGALLVGSSFVLGRALGGSAAGLLTALLVATSPAILFQLVAPMSDVVIAALWIAALVVAIPNRTETWLGAGTISSLAILTRPNTAPIAAVFVVAALINWADSELRPRLWKVTAYVTGTLPGVFSVAAIQTALYGSPFSSGYGTASDIYALNNFFPNVGLYGSWLLSSETLFVCLALAAPFFIRERRARWVLMLTVLCAGATWACYLFYIQFDVWWYLRFLLTSFPCIFALTAVTFIQLLRKLPRPLRAPVVVAILVPLVFWRVEFAAEAGTFRSWRLERRYRDIGRLVDRRLPPNAILFSMQHSGSLRYYAHRPTVRWDRFDGVWLDQSMRVLKEMGYKPYFVLEDAEQIDFKTRFKGKSRYGQVDWPPVAEVRNTPGVRIYDPDAAK
jgi:hypothetical protein